MRIKNQALLFCVLTGLLLLMCGCKDAQPTNLVLITIDTLRSDHCSCYGYVRETTPNLDRLAEKGARFEAVYSPMPTTGPTHSSILTSLYPMTHGVIKNGYILQPSFSTMSELLKFKGYGTAAFVSSFALKSKFGYKQGFDHYDDDFSGQLGTFKAKTWEGMSLKGESFDRPANLTTQRAMEWVKKHSKDKRPFFLWVHYFDPHQPFTPPEEYKKYFTEDEPFVSKIDRKTVQYDREIRFADHEMGKLLDCIETELQDKPTLIVATSDHGEGLMNHGHMGHGLLVYEEAVRLPLVMTMKGKIKPGSVYKAPVEVGDIMPTAFSIMGIDHEKQKFHGRDLSTNLLDNNEPPYDRMVFMQRRHYNSTAAKGNKYSIRKGDWKFIFAMKDGVEELYNLKEDPGELKNLVTEEPEVRLEMSNRLKGFVSALKKVSKTGLQNVSEEDNKKFEALGYIK